MATETTIVDFSIADGQLMVDLGDGTGWSINWPPPEDALEQLQQNASGIVPDFIRLLIATHPAPETIKGSKVILDFQNPAAIVQLEPPSNG